MPLDPAANFVRENVTSSIGAADTTIDVADASAFDFGTGYNCVVWDPSNNPRPDADPNREIVRVTAVDTGTNTLTVSRGQEETSAASHPDTSLIQHDYTAKLRDDLELQKLVEDPVRPPIARLDDGESIEIPVRVPNGDTLEVYRWGAFDASDGSAPTDLDVQLKDGSDTVQASENTANNQSTSSPVASHNNASGSASIFKLCANNGTGSAINSPGVGCVFGFRVVTP